MTQQLFWTLTMLPGPMNKHYTEPSKQRGFLTEKAARHYYDKQYAYSQHWINPAYTEEPLGVPNTPDQFYVVLDNDGDLETGSYSSVSPKLYKLRDAKSVAKKNDRQWQRLDTAPSRVVPVTLTFGRPIL